MAQHTSAPEAEAKPTTQSRDAASKESKPLKELRKIAHQKWHQNETQIKNGTKMTPNANPNDSHPNALNVIYANPCAEEFSGILFFLRKIFCHLCYVMSVWSMDHTPNPMPYACIDHIFLSTTLILSYYFCKIVKLLKFFSEVFSFSTQTFNFKRHQISWSHLAIVVITRFDVSCFSYIRFTLETGDKQSEYEFIRRDCTYSDHF